MQELLGSHGEDFEHSNSAVRLLEKLWKVMSELQCIIIALFMLVSAVFVNAGDGLLVFARNDDPTDSLGTIPVELHANATVSDLSAGISSALLSSGMSMNLEEIVVRLDESMLSPDDKLADSGISPETQVRYRTLVAEYKFIPPCVPKMIYFRRMVRMIRHNITFSVPSFRADFLKVMEQQIRDWLPSCQDPIIPVDIPLIFALTPEAAQAPCDVSMRCFLPWALLHEVRRVLLACSRIKKTKSDL